MTEVSPEIAPRDAIDELVDWQMRRQPREVRDRARCVTCGTTWRRSQANTCPTCPPEQVG